MQLVFAIAGNAEVERMEYRLAFFGMKDG